MRGVTSLSLGLAAKCSFSRDLRKCLYSKRASDGLLRMGVYRKAVHKAFTAVVQKFIRQVHNASAKALRGISPLGMVLVRYHGCFFLGYEAMTPFSNHRGITTSKFLIRTN